MPSICVRTKVYVRKKGKARATKSTRATSTSVKRWEETDVKL